MTYIEPKTTWSGDASESFNITPDYARIKGNIEHIDNLQDSTIGYQQYDLYPLYSLTKSSVPYADHFNLIVTNLNYLRSNYDYYNISINDFEYMRTYSGNSYVPDYSDLNIIEKNIKRLYELQTKIINNKQKMPIELGHRQYF